MKTLRVVFILSFIVYLTGNTFAQDYAGVKYGSETRQFLDIYKAPSTTPTPVFFYAHPNGGTTAMPSSIVDSLKSNGISIVSWESLTTLSSEADIQTGWNDCELMFAWVKANAAVYNFDTTKFIIGGSSRGSIISWRYAQRPNPGTVGIYMYDALPSVWNDPAWWLPTNDVKVTAPPIFFVYAREPGCSTNPTDPNIHDPNNGYKICDKYTSLGIGNRDTLVHSLKYTSNKSSFQFLLSFALKVIKPRLPAGINTIASDDSGIKVFPNPFFDSIKIEGLKGNEYFYITNSLGCILAEGNSYKSLSMNKLNHGICYLQIQSNSKQTVFKLIKI